MNPRIIVVWGLIFAIGAFITMIIIADQNQVPVTDLPKPVMSSAR